MRRRMVGYGGRGVRRAARSPAPSGAGPQAACPDGRRAAGRAAALIYRDGDRWRGAISLG
ncbi:hypothetical protein GCM10010517_70560 [Streptosporangium fragile]|uniref:Uncharacterized protein n=1 Tax=Streptosporangium fragile TaxID=46186 RepID=A0ABN3WA64_9ACTN